MGQLTTVRVGLEEGRTWTFASAVDWPGWCRRGKGIEGALDELASYRDRYRTAVGVRRPKGPIEIIGRVPGGTGTDFGAPMVTGPWDEEPVDAKEAKRLAGLLVAGWDYFDRVVAGSPAELRKGPRGGGRDRDKMVDHVREAERSYAPKVGVRVPPRTPWSQQREMIAATVVDPDREGKWPLRYAVRRVAWHVLDHAWEMEDKRV